METNDLERLLRSLGVDRDIPFTGEEPVCMEGEFDYDLNFPEAKALLEAGVITADQIWGCLKSPRSLYLDHVLPMNLPDPFHWVHVPSWVVASLGDELFLNYPLCSFCGQRLTSEPALWGDCCRACAVEHGLDDQGFTWKVPDQDWVRD